MFSVPLTLIGPDVPAEDGGGGSLGGGGVSGGSLGGGGTGAGSFGGGGAGGVPLEGAEDGAEPLDVPDDGGVPVDGAGELPPPQADVSSAATQGTRVRIWKCRIKTRTVQVDAV